MDPKSGGPSEAVRLLVRHAPPGYTSEVVTLDNPGDPFLEEVGCPVTAVGPVATTYGRTPRLIPWLEANKEHFDGVVVHGLWQYCGYAVWRVMGGPKPYVVFPHGMLDPYFKRRFPLKHLKKWLYWLWAEYWVLRGARRVFFTCGEEMRLAAESFWLHRWKGRVVPFGASAYEGSPAVARNVFLAAYPELRDKRFLLFLGRIDPKKGCDLLMDAFARQAKADPELHLVMAGPDAGNWRPELENAVAAVGAGGRVHWPGMLLGDLKWGAFYTCEAFVLPSHQENFGMAVAEALSCGKPVLLSDKVNIAPDVARFAAGLMETDTLAGTEHLLKRWMTMSAADREKMAAHALDCYRENYNLAVNAAAIVRLCAGQMS
jgi:glycosyltransferase involved in cell wall biosynthesis